MNEFYGKYKNIRNGAWQLLLDYNISKLPLNLTYIAKNSDIKIIKNSSVHLLNNDENGLCTLNKNQWYIIYDDTLSTPDIRFAIAHELGHIFLGHPLKLSRDLSLSDKTRQAFEYDADKFAMRILSPACVLWGLNLHTAEEIASVCGISKKVAALRAHRMELLYRRNKFLSEKLEMNVYNNFSEFINSAK